MKFKVVKDGIFVKPECAEDVYVISKLVSPGIPVRGRTFRKLEIKRGDSIIKTEKKPVVLEILTEKTEFRDGRLRITGKIVSEKENIRMSYHTIEVKEGNEIFIRKKPEKWEIERLESSRKVEKVLVCILDETEADIYEIGNTQKHLAHYTSGRSKKSDSSLKPDFFGEVIKKLKSWKGKIIIAGPGFAKEELAGELGGNVFVDSVSHTGKPGLNELLRRGTIEKVLKQSRMTEETKAVERLLEEIAKDGPVVYGPEETRKAVQSGAVDVLLVSEKKVPEFEDVMELAEKTGARVFVVSTEHEAGEKFLHLSGIGAFLRFRI
ncbi:MAG: mRNA surveillance protein pelota [Candidatus Micrarchaeota archaeon]|nr:mRNA surveillance protein pelota [Candidatus Micrarchaeota archaeon]